MRDGVKGRRPKVIRSVALFAALAAISAGLVGWKVSALQGAEAAAAGQPEPVEVVTAAVAEAREHRAVLTAIGTVLATRSVTLRNEVPGTVRRVHLVAGQVVEQGTPLVALDVSVEEAELAALEAQAALAATTLARVERMHEHRAASAIELDNARAERDVALAQMARIRAVIERKTLRAPFRARVGIADVHPGQFLDAGTHLTTLQGVDAAADIDFAVAQAAAAELRAGDMVEVHHDNGGAPFQARVVAVDARVERATRSATVRARIEGAGVALTPGASVRVRVPIGVSSKAVAIPVSALRKGPGGDHVFVIEDQGNGQGRARERMVQAGPVLGPDVVILVGLSPGERVAVSGSFKLRDGALVSVPGAEPPAGPARVGTEEEA